MGLIFSFPLYIKRIPSANAQVFFTLLSLSTMATKRNVSSEQGKKTQPVIDEAVAHGWEIPDFSIKEIRDAIPAHCFERDTLRSFSHVAYDLSIIAALGYAATFIDQIPYSWIRVLLWPAYWIAQGIVATGVWVIAHECGHQAFSPSKVCMHFMYFTSFTWGHSEALNIFLFFYLCLSLVYQQQCWLGTPLCIACPLSFMENFSFSSPQGYWTHVSRSGSST